MAFLVSVALVALGAFWWPVGAARALGQAGARVTVSGDLDVEIRAYHEGWDWVERKARRQAILRSDIKVREIAKALDRMSKEERREGRKLKYQGEATELRPGAYRIIVRTREKYSVELLEGADPPSTNLLCFLDFVAAENTRYRVTGAVGVAKRVPHTTRQYVGDMVRIRRGSQAVHRLTAFLAISGDVSSSGPVASCVFPS